MNHPHFDTPSLEIMSTLLPAFDFTSLISSDDYGAVYLAKQRSLERNVAIKILAPQFSDNPAFQKAFDHTARSMAKLNHPNLIRVYDSGCVERILYVVMEFVPGKSLEKSTKGQSVEIHQAMLLIAGICEGLAHAHDHQIIHGDLNPSNILLNQKAEPKIGNFGLSRPADPGAADKSSSRFIAPEVLTNPERVDPRADIHAVGAILYELLTGQPHNPDAAPPSAFLRCGPKLDEIWRQATHVNPDLRFPDMRSLAAALKDVPAATRVSIPSATPASNRLAVPPSSAESGAPPSPPTTRARTTGHAMGPNWKLIRNLFIIAGLLLAISITWKNLDKAKIQRERENRETLAQEQKARDEARKQAKQTPPKTPTENPASSGRVVPDIVVETPAESLKRLREDLASGSRIEMPVGSLQKGENHYFFVSKPMSWPDAAWFAEQHGGHLAIPNTTANLTWLAGDVAGGRPTWIGAARSGRNTWALADGSVWKPAKEPTGIGQYLACDKHGFLHAEKAVTLRPFIIQWHRDGTNPGTLSALLDSTRNSLTRPNPVFPPGTRAYGVRHYLFVSRPVDWKDAVDLAAKAGGHLAVPSRIAEIINLEEMTRNMVSENGIWLGGFLKGDHWLWVTGEPWKTAKWIDGTITTAPNSALIIRPGQGWDARDLSKPASGFIIEWSKDAKSATAPEIQAPAREGDPSALVAKAKGLIIAADETRRKKLVGNVNKCTWDLDQFIRSLTKGGKATWSPHVARLKSFIEDNRVPSAIPKDSGISMSDEMAKISQYHAKKQAQYDAEFVATAENIRIAFIEKLKEAQSQATASGQPKLAQSISKLLNDASNLERWVRPFGVEVQPKNPVLTASPE